MRKAVLLLTPVFATAALLACQDDSTNPGGAPFTFDAGTFDAPVQPPTDAGALPVTVFVTSAGQPEANVTVYWHDAAGAVIGTTKTGADGKAASTGATPAMASALLGDPQQRSEIITWTAVAAGDVLRATDLDVGHPGGSYGTYAVTLAGADAGTAASYAAYTGPCWVPALDPSTPLLLGLSLPSCNRNPSSVLASAADLAGVVLAYAFKKGNTPPVDGGSVPVTTGPWLTPTDVSVTASNAPQGASPTAALIEVAEELGFTNKTAPSAAALPATFKVAPGFADAIQVGVLAQPGPPGSTVLVGKRAAPAASFAFDFNDALPVITGGTIDVTNRARPQISWTSAASLASADGGSVTYRWINANESDHSWTFIVPPDATSVRAPTLPPDVGAWLPLDSDASPVFNRYQFDVLFAESDLLPSYTAFRSVVGVTIPGLGGGDPLAGAVLPSTGTFRATQCTPPLP